MLNIYGRLIPSPSWLNEPVLRAYRTTVIGNHPSPHPSPSFRKRGEGTLSHDILAFDARRR